MRRIAFVGLSVLAACSTAAPERPVARKEVPQSGDVVRMKSGESFSGRIVTVDANDVVLESGDRVRTFPKRDVAEVSTASRAMLKPGERIQTSIPPSTWYPRTNSREAMLQVEVTFFEPHPLAGCLGDMARSFEEIPDLVLFAEAGGKIRLHDVKKWGYHCHILPGDIVRKPVEKPGLLIDLPRNELPQALAFVSPAQEMKMVDGARSSYAIPDAVYARLREMSSADATLGAQAFTGGRARATKLGDLWAFTMPRNDRQFVVYLLDASGKHAKVLEQSFAAYGEAALAPDLMIDVLNADGKMAGRVMVVPMPEMSADGPAPEAVRILVGADGYLLTTVPVPPRQSVLMPMKAPSVRAEVHITCYESSKLVPERLVTAWGTGKSGATVMSREVLPETADETVKIDLSSLSAERFPAVAWFYHRRAYVWREGSATNAADPRLPESRHGKPAQVLTNAGRLPHVTPILFVGAEPRKDDSLLDSPVVGGMTNALMSDALGREAGAGFQALTALTNVIGEKGTAKTSSSSSEATSVTNIYITIPPHTGMTDPVGAMTGAGLPYGPTMSYYPGGWGNSAVNPYVQPGKLGKFPMSNYTVTDNGTGTINSRSGEVLFDPATGTLQGSAPTSGYWTNQGLGFGFQGGTVSPTFGPQFIFTNRKDK